ncbi:MAG: cell division protein ZapE [Gammaproteobacteria bacterium]|nr:cell division protein ZapE [Gammaproteobacteria bacterium]NIM72750.1 cell division protein ZapE [Gammaproteobacteria bacterium]NIN38207.1 cell division protein ZapE [Gammaproteobacteria bacterium]NIO24498.1 cell division protein ZapE [Gammaproteobacteria bacterium]NIO65107.1 cell division protein ZapE [Gammaproteobacteria bacterium]
MTPMDRYLAALERGELLPDPAQRRAVEHTQRLFDELVAAEKSSDAWLQRLRSRLGAGQPPPVRGLYLWGGVGRGKTHIVNSLYAALPFRDKMRVHFHSFMQLVHQKLRALGQRRDPLLAVADDLAADARVICFDEFHVSDITDAMLLGRLLRALFARGVTLVATSNIAPDDLYLDGLQREQFLPTIELIKSHTEVVHLDGQLDYRLRVLERSETYHCPLDAAAEQALLGCFEALAEENVRMGGYLDIAGRTIETRAIAEGIVWFDYAEICETPRSAADYMEIARCFHTVLLSNVPVMDDELRDRVVRFIHLIDELYEHNVNLVLSAAALPEALYAGKSLAARFDRARSRLVEMQSRDYLAAKHLP